MRKLSRRSLAASAATLPALVVPASATAIAGASGHPDSRLLELERQIVALDVATTEAGVPWDESEDAMFAWEQRNPAPKEKKTERPKLEPDPDLDRALARYGDQISKTVRDLLPILMESSADSKLATAEYERELSRWNERRSAASVNCRYEKREHEFERLIEEADACSATAARICNVRRVACGLSQATNSTPESIIVAMNATFRERRHRWGFFLHVESTPGTAQITSNLLNRSRRGAGRPTVAGHHHRRPARSAPQSYFAGGGGGGRCLMLSNASLILVASNG
jgi:hypothetical protein